MEGAYLTVREKKLGQLISKLHASKVPVDQAAADVSAEMGNVTIPGVIALMYQHHDYVRNENLRSRP